MPYKLKRNGKDWLCDVIKSCHLSCGVNIYLLKRYTKGTYINSYVVGVRKGDQTLEFQAFLKLSSACSFYLDMICCYA